MPENHLLSVGKKKLDNQIWEDTTCVHCLKKLVSFRKKFFSRVAERDTIDVEI